MSIRSFLPGGMLALLTAALPAEATEPLLVWARSGSTTPWQSQWNGSSWPSATSLPSVGGHATWVVLRACPTRDEFVAATLDYDKHINAVIRTGSSWGSVTEVGTAAGQDSDRGFDVAYSVTSGTALIAYWNDSTQKLCYRTSSGSGWSPQATLTLPATSKLRYLRLHPIPSSDQIVMLCANEDKDLFAATWNGSGFDSVTTIESMIQTIDEECFAMAFESTSEHGLLVYAEDGQNTPRYRTFISGAWSPEASVPSVGQPQRWVRLAAEPGTDRIVLATLDNDSDLNACIWSGTAWGSVSELETHMRATDRRCFDVAFRATGSALVAYVRNSQHYTRFRSLSGSTWSGHSNGPNVGDAVDVVQLTPDGAGNIYVACRDAGADLSIMRYDGSTLALQAAVESSVGGDEKTEPFMLAVPLSTTAAKPRIVQWYHVPPQ